MNIIVYGYYNYANTYDQKEHYTLTPKSTIDSRSDRDYSGNRYVYDVDISDLNLRYSIEEEDGYTVDYFYDCRSGGIQWSVFDYKGCLYLIPADPALRDPDSRIKLGMLYKHKVEG